MIRPEKQQKYMIKKMAGYQPKQKRTKKETMKQEDSYQENITQNIHGEVKQTKIKMKIYMYTECKTISQQYGQKTAKLKKKLDQNGIKQIQTQDIQMHQITMKQDKKQMHKDKM